MFTEANHDASSSFSRRKRPKSYWRFFLLSITILFAGVPFLLWETAVSHTQAAAGEINGTVFRDFDSDGTRDALEPGVISITVSAYNDSGFVLSTTTNITGEYSLTGLTDTSPYRIELTNLPDYLEPGPNGTNSGTTSLFATSPADNVDVGLHNPGQYCQNNPDLATTCFDIGDQSANNPVLISIPYTAEGNNDVEHSAIAEAPDLGAVHGIAYNDSSDLIYVGAVQKRHTDFGNSPGTIFAVNATSGAVSTFVDLDAVSSATFVGTLHDTTDYEEDFDAFPLVGKVSLGDVEISHDNQTVFTINLYSKELIEIPVANPTAPNISEHAIPVPASCDDIDNNGTTPANADLQAYGLSFHDGLLYVGLVCTAQSTQDTDDLHAYVYTFNPNNDTWSALPILEMALDYPRGCAASGGDSGIDCRGAGGNAGDRTGEWRPWIDTWAEFRASGRDGDDDIAYPMAMLADIEFDNNGDMILGFRDRWGDMWGPQVPPPGTPSDRAEYKPFSAGDILRARPDGSGTFTLESNAQLPGDADATDGENNDQGPGGGEFYFDDHYDNGPNDEFHAETSQGSLVFVSGQPDVVVTVMDPEIVDSGGLAWYSNTTGGSTRGYEVFQGVSDGNPTLWGKSNGLGDLEAFCESAPLEIGNFVWIDADGDGIQDPSELGLDSVTITLHDMTAGGAIVGTAVTSNGGLYYFGGIGDTNMSSGSLLTGRNYEIRVDMTQVAITTPGYHLTSDNVVQPANGDSVDTSNSAKTDLSDSDAILDNTIAVISVTTGSAGENNHTLDIGFTTVPLAIGLADITIADSASAPPLLMLMLSLLFVSIFLLRRNKQKQMTL